MIVARLCRGRRVYLFKRWRVHHGLTGAALALVGFALMLDDLHDWPWSLRD